jgi:hypothetical protein
VKFGGVLALLAALAGVSCHPLDEGSGETPPPIGSIVGVWTISESGNVTDARCIPPANPYILYVAQNGNVVTAQTGFDPTSPFDPTLGSNGAQFSGMISSNALTISGANADGTGTMQTATAATVGSNCNTLSGTRTLQFTEGAFTCTSVPPGLTLTGTRLVGSGCAGTLAATAVPESTTSHNTAATAQAITRPAEVSGTISSGMDQDDWYSFTLSSAGPFTVLLNGPAAPTNIDLFLTDDAGTTQLGSSTNPSSREAIANTVAAGTYKVRISPPASGTVSYTLLIQ